MYRIEKSTKKKKKKNVLRQDRQVKTTHSLKKNRKKI